jgi:DNA replication protein DnaC
MHEAYEQFARKAEQNSLTYEQFLLELAQHELSIRKDRRINKMLRASGLPIEKSLETFDLKRLPQKLALQVKTLLDGAFIDKKENVLAFGNPGSGKTHLLSAIAQALIHQGRKIHFTTCTLLVPQLLAAKRDLKLARLLKKFASFHAILLDDIGYVQQDKDEIEVLFTFLADRYEKSSLLITSNLPFSKWERIFKDPITTTAAIDRLVHHRVILELNISSYRMQSAKQKTT